MEESTSTKVTDSTNPAGDRSAGSQQPPNPASGNPIVAPAQPAAAPGTVTPAVTLLSAKYVADLLGQAELLLGYAAEVGIEVEDKVRDGVLKARVASDGGGITGQAVDNLLTALTALAVKVRPVTVESLKACADSQEARSEIRFYGRMAMGIGCLIVIFSLCTFVSSGVSDQIKKDIETANGLASKLRAELGPSPPGTNQPPAALINSAPNEVWFGAGEPPRGLVAKDIISDLQQFAAIMREIDGYARQLNHFLFNSAHDPYAEVRTNRTAMRKMLELTPGLEVPLSQELSDRVEVYQHIRNFGNSVQERVTVYYGAIATCILPVLYALLGAGAYLLRLHEDQIKNRTFVGGDRHVARFLIAGIGGLVVGLFNNVTQGVTISPFATAFLVGYAVDVFFTFLEGLLQMFKRVPGNPGAPGTPSKSSN